MKKIILYTVFSLLTASAFAQTLIAVQNGGTPRFYSILQDALTAAQNKDTIYIPGGAYSLTNSKITIDKELHLIGAGHYQDSTVVGITQLNASIVLVTGANNSSFEGFYLRDGFYCGTSTANEDVDNITILRCNCGGATLGKLSTNWTIRECVLRGGLLGYGTLGSNASTYAQNNLFSNNMMFGYCQYFGPNNSFQNNLFLFGTGNVYFNAIDGSIFRNNVFSSSSSNYITSCIFENNIFFWTSSWCPSTICNNNIFSQTSATTFVNQSGTTFDYKQDYHLKSDSPGKNSGKDGTDIGIYGGIYPWKEGSVPSNPHFKSVKISPKTDNSGNLNVKIKVAAQDN